MEADTLESAMQKARACAFAHQPTCIVIGYADAETTRDGQIRLFPMCWGRAVPGLNACDDSGRKLIRVEVMNTAVFEALRFKRRCLLEGDMVEPKPRSRKAPTKVMAR